MQESILTDILSAAVAYDGADPKRIHHLLKVHAFARLIARGENCDAHTCFVLEAAAALHDIGIHEAERVHGSNAGVYQQMEGPAVARELLRPFALPSADTDRICWLIGHHHTYHPVDGLDHQMLLEADFLVNAYESSLPAYAIRYFHDNTARTATGKALIRSLYLPED